MISKPNCARWAAVVVAAVCLPTRLFADSAEPADPIAPVPAVVYRGVLHDYRPPSIVEKPGGWKELNQRAEQIGGPGGQLKSPDQPIRRKTK